MLLRDPVRVAPAACGEARARADRDCSSSLACVAPLRDQRSDGLWTQRDRSSRIVRVVCRRRRVPAAHDSNSTAATVEILVPAGGLPRVDAHPRGPVLLLSVLLA